jgi:acetylornithine deacetylase/succinyl-diaminopimelate desuccinylase-like protein
MLKDYLRANQQRHLSELLDFVRIPSVSTDSGRQGEVRRAAEFVASKLTELGFEAQRFETPRHPVVVARYRVSDSAPTVLVYGHYDVQPPEPLALWTSPPFEPVVENGLIVARGASDDKGQLYAHIKGAEALLATTGTLPVNLTFVIEGEEEIGSPNLTPFIEAHRELLAADIVLISDGAMVAPDTPTITYGLRGLAYVEVVVRGAGRDLHSGAYGGGAPNAINALAKIIARLHDEQGCVTVPGFYDAVLELTDTEREAFRQVPFDEAHFKREAGLTATPGELGYTLLERLWARPTLDCNGIGGGFQGEGAKTVIAAEARAKISCRLVPNQDPHDIAAKLAAHLKNLAPPGVEVAVTELHGALPALTPLEAPAVKAAAQALAAVFGRPTVFARTGGTIPVVSTIQELLGAQVVMVGLGLESDKAHSPNEKFDLVNYYRGIEASTALLAAFTGTP